MNKKNQCYTIETHAENLIRLLNGEKGQPCGECPAEIDWDRRKGGRAPYHPNEVWPDGPNPCSVCLNFIGLHHTQGYPCIVLGTELAIKKTTNKLREYGYSI